MDLNNNKRRKTVRLGFFLLYFKCMIDCLTTNINEKEIRINGLSYFVCL